MNKQIIQLAIGLTGFAAVVCVSAFQFSPSMTIAQRAVSELQEKSKNVFVRFEDDGRNIYAHLQNQHGEDDFDDPVVGPNAKRIRLVPGEGIPVEEITGIRKSGGVLEPLTLPPIKSHRTPRLHVHSTDMAGRKVTVIRMVDSSHRSVRFRGRHWSADGNYVYASIPSQPPGFVLIDAKNWNILNTVELQHASDLTVTNHGLVITEPGNRAEAIGSAWTQIATNDNGENRIWLLDSETFRLKKCWKLRGNAIAGTPDSSVVFIRQIAYSRRSSENPFRHRILVFDVACGELTNAFPIANTKRDFPSLMRLTNDRAFLFLGQKPSLPLATPGNLRHILRQNLHSRDNSSVTRFQIDGKRASVVEDHSFVPGEPEGYSPAGLRLLESLSGSIDMDEDAHAIYIIDSIPAVMIETIDANYLIHLSPDEIE